MKHHALPDNDATDAHLVVIHISVLQHAFHERHHLDMIVTLQRRAVVDQERHVKRVTA